MSERMRVSVARVFPLCLTALLLLALYGQFFNNPIVFDDLAFFMLDAENQLPIFTYHFNCFELRSLPYATLAWSAGYFGVAVIHFRVENLLLHLAVVVVLFIFIHKISGQVRDVKNHVTPQYMGAVAAAVTLFALHPIATYAVGYLVQRTIIMGTLFGLLALLAYFYGCVRQNGVWFVLSTGFYYLAIFSKEHLIMLPAVMLAMTVLLHEDWWVQLRKRWWAFLTMAVAALILILARKSLIGEVYEINAPEMLSTVSTSSPYLLSVLTQATLFFKYAFLWVFPNTAWMSIDMREPFAHSVLSPYLLGGLAYVAWGGGAIWLLFQRGEQGLIGFALLFPWLMFFTEFSTVRIQENFVLYRSYIWAAGAFILIPLFLDKMRPRMMLVLLLLVIPTLFMLSLERLSTFSHPVLLWDDAEKLVVGRDDLPGTYRIYYNRGTELIKIKQYDRAIQDLKRALELRKDLASAYGNMGSAYYWQGNYLQAMASFGRAIQLAEEQKELPNPRHYYGRALAFEKLGEVAKAKADFEISCKLGNAGCDKVAPVAKAH